MHTRLTSTILLCITTLVLCTCTGRRDKEANRLLVRVDSLRQAGLYAEALQLLERIQTERETNAPLLREVSRHRSRIRMNEAEMQMVRLEDELQELDKQISAHSRGFVTLQQGSKSWLSHPILSPEYQGTRPHLRVMVDTLGTLQMASVYVGTKPINHSSLNFSLVGIDSTTSTPSIPHDATLNYRYMDGENYWELVTYTNSCLTEVAPYLSQNHGRRLRIEFLSNQRIASTYTLSNRELTALYTTLELRQMFAERSRLRQEQNKYAQRYLRLSQRG